MLTLNRSNLSKMALFISIITLCALILSMVFLGLKQFKLGSQLSGNAQVSHLSHALVRQQANLLSVLLANTASQDMLNASLAEFCQQDFALDATLYASNGAILASAGEQPFNETRLKMQSPNQQQIVEPITNAAGLQGYLRVSFDIQYSQAPSVKLNHLFHQLYAQLIIVFLCGAIFASSLHFWHKKVHIMPFRRPNRYLPQQKSPALRFHANRRRIK
ncbi:hemolysin regulation protein AhpA [Pasteurellaceae bacterium HPA106]|uniref:YtjB family periplasmic protein n=1 Tax=Spirabiliibacterium pneumoniae TaxID=221400 RepID=UPI001AACDEF7|nr:AhpA/YtjB family protein [Spirabiliibacterium pneumoniae]MBE2896413.1 hemolysin regulation protein AhpA [Spirabiliibacterium pneumoniae]